MKALLLLVLPWLSPANYTDNVGNLHILYSELCKGASHYGLSADRKRRSQEGDCTDSTSELTVATLPCDGPASAAVALLADDPGLVNPAFEPSMEDNSQSGSTSSLAARSSSKKIRNFDRSSVRSRSFRRLNRAFSVLRRTKSGNAVSNETTEERDNVRNAGSPQEVLALPQLHHLIPDGELTSIKITRVDPADPLAISIVGGNETPLVRILIQDIYREGVIARDGRLLPGDMILKVNGIDISNVAHCFALTTLKQPCTLLRLTVLREQRHRYRAHSHGHAHDAAGGGAYPAPHNHHLASSPPGRDDSVHVVLSKNAPDEQLGIKLVRRTDEAGVFVLDLLDGGLAAKDGRLWGNDRVLAVNDQDLRHGTPEQAAQIIQASGERVHLLIGRPTKPTPPPPPKSSSTRDLYCLDHFLPNHSGSPSPVPTHPSRATTHRDLSQCVSCKEKHITVKKEPQESLGMTVAGGRGSKSGELPIFVTSVQPHGCLSRDGRIKRGDILLSINGQDLTYLSHSEAVGTLKASAATPAVQLRALEVSLLEERGQQDQLLAHSHDSDYDANWSPSWVMWLGLPSYLHSSHEIVLRRSHPGSWGFSIVGGYEETHGNQAFFIKTIVLGTPAYYDGRLKCGDMIVAVNGLSTAGMSHSALVPMLKEQRSRVALTVVSWPGSLA